MVRTLQILGLVAFASILIVGFAGLALWIVSDGDPVDYVQASLIRFSLAGQEDALNATVSTNTSPVRFTVNAGDTPRLIAQNLQGARLISDPELFIDYVRAYNLDTQLEAGTFFLNQAQSIPQIAAMLTDSGSGQFAFRILEGWRIEEIAAQIDASPFFGFSGGEFLNAVGIGADVPAAFAAWAGLPPGSSLEGFLFPDTYQLPANLTPDYLVEVLLTNFESRVQAARLPERAAADGLTLFQAVTLASIIQREAVHPDEHPMISSVYRNRLAINMKLDADPTVQYGIGFNGSTWWPRITQADYVNTISPYNTYLSIGLPPGPIANPGLSAIEAAVQPAVSDYFYFQARCTGDGYHNFARTFDEHLANSCF
ncbi:MAG: endolytic transglycosylase MltG [bacterium]|nr:endolytic transglycosylase MltG [bacterium]